MGASKDRIPFTSLNGDDDDGGDDPADGSTG
jgi:hypothetical protein